MIKGNESQQVHSEFALIDSPETCQQMQSQCLHGIFSSEHLQSNMRKLDQYYAQKLTPDELDERHFISTDNKL